jgi:hypothetical protein
VLSIAKCMVTDHSRDFDFQKEIVAKTGIPVTLRAERSYCRFDRRRGSPSAFVVGKTVAVTPVRA